MKNVTIHAPCKINLGLNILGLEGGYHLLDTVMMAIPLFDTIELSLRADGGINTTFCRENKPNTALSQIDPVNNSAYNAAAYVRDKFGVKVGADIKVTKRVPIAAGLGGSSCDAAGVLRAYGELLDLPITIDDAAALGSDTAFLWSSIEKTIDGTAAAARCTGRGELLEPFSARPLNIIIAVNGSVNTADCYKKFDELHPSFAYSPSNTKSLIAALSAGDIAAISKNLGNALEGAAKTLEPKIISTMELVRSTNPAAILMSGSGAAIAGLYKNSSTAHQAITILNNKCEFLWQS